jgi:shikimate 5-dehydrogenase
MIGGLAPDSSPIDVERMARMSPGVLVMDTVYKPRETLLLRAARAAGLRTLDGVGLFVGQACRQFEAWTGKPAPKQLFTRIVEEAFSDRGDDVEAEGGAP